VSEGKVRRENAACNEQLKHAEHASNLDLFDRRKKVHRFKVIGRIWPRIASQLDILDTCSMIRLISVMDFAQRSFSGRFVVACELHLILSSFANSNKTFRFRPGLGNSDQAYLSVFTFANLESNPLQRSFRNRASESAARRYAK